MRGLGIARQRKGRAREIVRARESGGQVQLGRGKVEGGEIPVLHRLCAGEDELLVQVEHLQFELVSFCLALCTVPACVRI